MATEVLFREESYRIVGACFEVCNELGSGFLEAVYQEALRREFQSQGIAFREKPEIELYYKGSRLDQTYQPDFLCFGQIIVELKTAKLLADDHRAQAINYLKATRKKLGLLVNFGHHPKLEHERLVN
ncbi:MAG: GxxExxY protein [Phycisphaerae bacterium]|nr:GxxExxY protein [Phycisphaerae bacterium]